MIKIPLNKNTIGNAEKRALNKVFDSGYMTMGKITKKFVSKNKNSYYFASLGRDSYLSILKYIDCIIGNSSSAIYDAPSFQLPAVNIGKRQFGRVYSNNIIRKFIFINSLNFK